MAVLWGKTYTRLELLRRVGDIRQLAQAHPFELADGNERGVRAVRLRNASGLDLTVVPDRGMAITDLSLGGIPLPFVTGVGVAHPAFSEPQGAGWLRTWPGGFLTTAGLTQVGTAAEDGGETLGLHGRVAGVPASEVRWGGEWKDDDYYLYVEGVVRQAAMFGEDISLHRRIGMWLGGSRFWIEDTVENRAFRPVPHMFLQHFNLGFPLIDAGTRLELPQADSQPRDETARTGFERYNVFDEPLAGFQEQVFYHHLQADANGQVEVRLINPGFDGGRGMGIYWRYALAEYPILVEWKMMGEGQYVVGIEPSNCYVEGRRAEREKGSLQVLQPFEKRHYRIEVGLVRSNQNFT